MIGELVKELQSKKRVSSAELARRIDSTPQQIVRWRSQADLKVMTLLNICQALEVGQSELAELLTKAMESSKISGGDVANERLQQFFKQTGEGQAEGPGELDRVLSSTFGHQPVTSD